MLAVGLRVITQTIQRIEKIALFLGLSHLIPKINQPSTVCFNGRICSVHDKDSAEFILAALTMPNSQSILNKKDKNGDTTLLLIVKNDDNGSHYIRCAKLLEHGANPNVLDREGNTPLDIAIKKKNETMIELLKSFGATTHSIQK